MTAAAVGALAVGAAVMAPSALADVDSASVTPAVWAQGSSPAFTVTLHTSGTLNGSLGFWTGGQGLGFTVNHVGVTSGTLVGDTVTCEGSGVTYQSSALSELKPGDYADVCWINWGGSPSDYVDNWLEIAEMSSITGDYTWTITYPAGVWIVTAPAGTYAFQAYAYDSESDIRSDFDVTVSPSAVASPGARYLQQVSLPASGNCDAIPDAELAWGTGLSGGWVKNWGEWLNDRNGGWACSRVIAWSSATEGWVIDTP